MFQLQMRDRTKTAETAVYYMEDKDAIQEYWRHTEMYPEDALFAETDMKIGAGRDFPMEKCCLRIHNTKGQECRYYVEKLLIKVRWAKRGDVFLKLASFAATGIAKENEYDEGGYEQVTCCGNPVLDQYSSEITPLVSDFEDDFKREKISMLCYKEIGCFATLDEVNADIAKKEISSEEVEILFRDIPGELG
ncbi:MAG: hypothetical protein E7260_02255 [Lachnospiraceae bacterium]|nr:hypothetical protein [Lachnospiraceae bacterium]